MARFSVGLTVLIVTSTLVACLPAPLTDATLDVAVIGAPADELLPGAADVVDAFLRREGAEFDLIGSSTLRFLELRRGLVGSQVVPGAAAIGRSTGAEVVVIVSASTLTRTLIDDAPRAPFERLTLVLDARLVAAADARSLGVLATVPVQGERVLEEAILPPLDEDPLLVWAIEQAVEGDLGPSLLEALRDPSLDELTAIESTSE